MMEYVRVINFIIIIIIIIKPIIIIKEDTLESRIKLRVSLAN